MGTRTRRSLVTGALAALTLALSALPATAGAVTLKPGDILVADFDAFGDSDGGVILVNPATGKQTQLSSNDQPVNASSQFFGNPWSLTVTPTGQVLVTEWDLEGVLSIDPATGKQTVLSSNAQPINSGDPAAQQLLPDRSPPLRDHRGLEPVGAERGRHQPGHRQADPDLE